MDFEPFQVALAVARALDECGLRYVVGGSVASSLSGEPRSTLDVDLVVANPRGATSSRCWLRSATTFIPMRKPCTGLCAVARA